MPLIRMTARVEPEWLLDLFPDRIEERSSVVWNRIAEPVERVSALLYDKLERCNYPKRRLSYSFDGGHSGIRTTTSIV